MAKSIQRIENIQLGTASSLTRYGDKEDSLLITLPKTAKVSCQFTNNKLKAAPVKLAIEHLSHSSSGEKAFLINLIDNIFNFNYIQIFYSNNI